MRYSILFVAAVILVSGFIAYFGDLIGRRMGKKRLTLFNLRPRHTAVVVTIITGMIISATALILLVTANVQFKKLLTEGEQILENNKRLSSSNKRLGRLNVTLEQRSKQMEAEVAQRQREVVLARAQTTKATKARDKAMAEVLRLQTRIALSLKQLQTLQARSDAAERDLKNKTAELKSVQLKLALAESNLAAAQKDLTKAQQELAKAEKDYEEQAQKVRDQQKTIVILGNEKQDFERQASDLRSRQLVFRQGDEIVRGVIARQRRFKMRLDLLNLLTKASDKAEKLGAKDGSNGRAVSVVHRQVVSPNGDVFYTEDEDKCIDMALDAILSTFDDTLVQVVCQRNTMVGEQAPVEIRLYINNLIYVKGDKITSGRINGAMSEGRILLAVIDFLQKRVSETALRAGMVPVSNPDTRYIAGQNPQDQVEALMSIVDRIKSVNAMVTLDVFASKTVYSSDSLNMNNMSFEASPAQE